MQSKQLVEAEAKTQQSTIKKQKMAAETTAEVVWRPSAEDGKAATVAVAAKATSEGGRLAGRRKNGGDRSDSRRRVQRSLSNVIDDRKSWSNTSPNNNGKCGGGGSGSGGGVAVVARRITTPPPPTSGGLRFYRVAPTLAVECSTLYTASASSASTHPTNDRKDDDKSGGRVGTHHQCSDCDNVAGYHRRHISRDHD